MVGETISVVEDCDEMVDRGLSRTGHFRWIGSVVLWNAKAVGVIYGWVGGVECGRRSS